VDAEEEGQRQGGRDRFGGGFLYQVRPMSALALMFIPTEQGRRGAWRRKLRIFIGLSLVIS